MLKISQGVQFVVDGNHVLVKRKESLSRLAGPDVGQILIPLLPELEHGLSVDDSPALEGMSIQKVREILGKLLGIGYLTLCDQPESVDNDKEILDEITDVPTLGVIGSGKLYRELVTTFTSYPRWAVKYLEVEHLEEINDCEAVVFVNHGINDAAILALAKILHSSHTKYINVSFDDDKLQVGPYVQDGTACLQCCNSRRLANLTFAYEANVFFTAKRIYAAEDLRDLALEEVKFVTGIIAKQCGSVLRPDGLFQSPFQERVITFNLSTMQITSEEFFRNPRCHICGHSNQSVSEVKQWSVEPFSKESSL